MMVNTFIDQAMAQNYTHGTIQAKPILHFW